MQWFMVILEHHSHDKKKKKKTEKQKKNIERGTKKKKRTIPRGGTLAYAIRLLQQTTESTIWNDMLQNTRTTGLTKSVPCTSTVNSLCS